MFKEKIMIKRKIKEQFSNTLLLHILKYIYHLSAKITDLIIIPFTLLSSFWLRFCRKTSFSFSPVTKKILYSIGIFPIRDHYYEPLFNPIHLRKSLREDRFLSGIDLNVDEQMELLNRFSFNKELLSFPRTRTKNNLEFSYDYGAYPSGDSEIWYSIIRFFKPNKIIEIGCGSSTLMALNAINKNKKENLNYNCNYTCIEPYEQPWLEKTGVKVIRKKVEELSLNIFRELEDNDILFIDSSHIIRPQGDVLYEILEILPSLNSGVMVHFHDISTPKDYFDEWIYKANYFWNEQYLLEAFLSFNKEFKIILATNYLFHHHYELFISKCPILKIDREKKPERETGSFWIKKN